MKAYQQKAFDDWAKEHLDVGDETRAGDSEAVLNAESGWEAALAHSQELIDMLIEAAQQLSDALAENASHVYSNRCGCNSCAAKSNFLWLLKGLNQP